MAYENADARDPRAAVLPGFKYAETHEYAKIDGDVATVGISDFAQVRLGAGGDGAAPCGATWRGLGPAGPGLRQARAINTGPASRPGVFGDGHIKPGDRFPDTPAFVDRASWVTWCMSRCPKSGTS